MIHVSTTVDMKHDTDILFVYSIYILHSFSFSV